MVRFGKLTIHRSRIGTRTVYAAYDKRLGNIAFFIPEEKGRAIRRWLKRNRKNGKTPKQLCIPGVNAPLGIWPGDRVSVTRSSTTTKTTSTLVYHPSAKLKGIDGRLKTLQKKMDKIIEDGDLSNPVEFAKLDDVGTELEALQAERDALFAQETAEFERRAEAAKANADEEAVAEVADRGVKTLDDVLGDLDKDVLYDGLDEFQRQYFEALDQYSATADFGPAEWSKLQDMWEKIQRTRNYYSDKFGEAPPPIRRRGEERAQLLQH
jgi:hypothetical protein